jgi:hypothetical protein
MPLKLGTQDVTLKLGSQDVTAYLGAEEVSAFDPTSIEGLSLWLDAADGSTLFQNSDGTTPATEAGDPVGYWGDKSGNNRHATQATAASRPTISGTALNGRRNLTFSQQGLRGSFSPEISSTNYTVAAVVQTNTGAFNNQRVFATAAATGNDFSSGRVIPVLNNGQVSGSLSAYTTTSASPVSGFSTYGLFTGVLGSGGVQNSINGGRGASASGTLTSATARFGVGETGHHDGTARFTGAIAELLYYSRAVTPAELRRIELYLAAKWGITLAPQVSNADAQDWVNRVYANGGTVSESTAAAVNTFCNAIDAASIRDRFYRLNLFCGDSDASLVAVRTPLYRGPSLGGTQYGNALDTNNNFVQGDYAETGASGGLIGNTTTKYLDTGLATDALPQVATGHLSFWTRGGSVSGVRRPIGAEATVQANRFFMDRRPVANGGDLIHWGSLAAGNNTDDDTAGLFSGSRTSATDLRFYKDGVQVGTTQTGSATMTATDKPIFVFAGNLNGTPAVFYERRMASYSIGDGMTASQMLAYYNALNAFMGALSRT